MGGWVMHGCRAVCGVHLAAVMPPHPMDRSACADKLRIDAKGGLVRGHHRGKLGDNVLAGPRVGLLRRELPAVG